MSKEKKTQQPTAAELFAEFQKTYNPEANKAFVQQTQQDSKNLAGMVTYHQTPFHHGDLQQEQDNNVKKLGGTKHHSKCEIM